MLTSTPLFRDLVVSEGVRACRHCRNVTQVDVHLIWHGLGERQSFLSCLSERDATLAHLRRFLCASVCVCMRKFGVPFIDAIEDSEVR